MSAIANLINQQMSRTAAQNPAASFINAAQAAQQRNMNNLQMQAAQQAMQKQSALQGLLAGGAGATDLAAKGYLEEAAQLAKVNEDSSKRKNEFWKEERSAATQDVRAFNKEAKDMLSDYNSLNNNARLASSGDRGARNAMTVSVGRLMSPGIFTETEATALSGGQTPMQAIYETLMGKGKEGQEVWANIGKYVDPYGKDFNAEGLLAIGQNIVLSRSKPLVDNYTYSAERAKRSQMPDNQFKTIFGDNPYIAQLEQFAGGQAVGSVGQPQAQPGQAQQGQAQPASQPQTKKVIVDW